MDITVYLPDELGEQAKAAELNLSGLLRAAVTEELERRAAVTETLKETAEHIITLEDEEDRRYDGRIVGKEIAFDERNERTVYLTEDERVIVYDASQLKYRDVTDEVDDEGLSGLSPAAYVDAMHALGLKPVIDI